ncbi:D-2-hydroxyacid dehydrogenase [Tuberibacillus sp. Marseille-P3662]|uniref:D-2-hydroxyacid dehydrogenase n=1 Tax=Tuberibacillus sp. Marseille-P3662 TaxID=1965358 RepID=UPI000A1CD2F4|nr:D-2-hydroxyacid dehydrogenase [Tuberibacillus sp. Marseille-P3662]
MDINHLLITDQNFEELERLLEGRLPGKEVRFKSKEEVTSDDMAWTDAFVSFKPAPNFDVAQLKWVHVLGAGVDAFLFNQTWPDDVLMTRTICSFGKRIAEYCLSYILRCLQNHERFRQDQHNKSWDPVTPGLIEDQTIVVYGTGEIGQEVAKTLSMLGADTYGVSLGGRSKDYFKDVYAVGREGDILGSADVVINTLPLTAETHRMFNQTFFNQLQQAMFINVGRGGSVETEALVDGLDQDNVSQAVLDVFASEPLPADSPLWTRDDVSMTPHISAVTTPDEAADCFVDTLKDIEAGKSLENQVDIRKGY